MIHHTWDGNIAQDQRYVQHCTLLGLCAARKDKLDPRQKIHNRMITW